MTQEDHRKRGRQEETIEVDSEPTLKDIMHELKQMTTAIQSIPAMTAQLKQHEDRIGKLETQLEEVKTCKAQSVVSMSVASSDPSQETLLLVGGLSTHEIALPARSEVLKMSGNVVVDSW
eukprot:3939079-Amphidinium_carterae.2